MWDDVVRYPDPAVRVLDHSFEQYRLALAAVERIATGLRWAEGPVWFGDGRYLLWSDIPNNRILRWSESTGASRTSSASRPATPTATRATARVGWSPASIGGRRVTRTEYDGAITVLAERYDGKRLNSPNDRRGEVRRLDLVHRPAVRHRSAIIEGEKATQELPHQRLPRRWRNRRAHRRRR